MQDHHPPRGFTPEAEANIYHRVVNTDESLASIAADYRVHYSTIGRLCIRKGWRRKDRVARDVPPDVRLALEADKAGRATARDRVASEQRDDAGRASASAGKDAVDPFVADQLEQAVKGQLAEFEHQRTILGSSSRTSAEAERTVRFLERLANTLFKVRRLRAPEAPSAGAFDFDDIPGDIDEFRNQLAQRIEKFVQSWSGEAVPATGDPDEGDPAQS